MEIWSSGLTHLLTGLGLPETVAIIVALAIGAFVLANVGPVLALDWE